MRHSTNHTFVVCAYKESPYLEECIRSLVAQTVRSNIEIYTSTPNEYIRNIGEKYHIPVYVNEEAGQEYRQTGIMHIIMQRQIM